MNSVRGLELRANEHNFRSDTAVSAGESPKARASEGGAVVKEREKAGEKRLYELVKRAVDIIGSIVGMIVLLPVFLAISIIILSEKSGKHAIYKQRRTGRYGREIYIYKFRTMADDADNVEKWLNKKQLRQYYAEFKVADDPRVTRVGRFLRKTGLDELPQMLNILRGELSIVGPRPVQESELRYYGENKDVLLSVRPGLTGYWQVYCISENATYGNGKRQEMELHYIEKRGLLMDLKLILATFGALVRKAKHGQ